jgi:hypothetical protein
MTPSVVSDETLRLFAIEVQDHRGRSLEDVVLEALADVEHGVCPVCAGRLHPIAGGAACTICGSEILSGAEPAPAWVA